MPEQQSRSLPEAKIVVVQLHICRVRHVEMPSRETSCGLHLINHTQGGHGVTPVHPTEPSLLYPTTKPSCCRSCSPCSMAPPRPSEADSGGGGMWAHRHHTADVALRSDATHHALQRWMCRGNQVLLRTHPHQEGLALRTGRHGRGWSTVAHWKLKAAHRHAGATCQGRGRKGEGDNITRNACLLCLTT